LKLQLLPSDFSSATFEHALINDKQNKVLFVLVYRPFPSAVNGLKTPEFLKDFDEFLKHVNSYGSKIVMLGDFNVHMNKPDKTDIKQFTTSFQETGFCQHIIGPTHKDRNTLDLIISRPEDCLVESTSIGARLGSDHHVTFCTPDLKKPAQTKEKRYLRNFKQIDHTSFHNDLAQSFKQNISSATDIDTLTVKYNDTVTKCLDKYAPITTRTCNSRKRQPWYNEDIHVARRERRKHEKRWGKTSLKFITNCLLNRINWLIL
jgi:hypothetical protein